MRFLIKLYKRWQRWRFAKRKPVIAERHSILKEAVRQGNQSPVSRAKRGRYD